LGLGDGVRVGFSVGTLVGDGVGVVLGFISVDVGAAGLGAFKNGA